MERVSLVVFCGSANIENLGQSNQSIDCKGIISFGSVPGIPSFYSVALLIMATVKEGPIHTMRVSIISPDNDQIFDETLKVESDKLPQIDVAETITMALNIQNLVIRSAGDYVFKFYINDEFDSEKQLKIKQRIFI